MSSHGDDTAELLQLIADSRVTGYLAVTSLCVLIYDHIVELMWSRRWGLAKIVYLWNRYFSLVAIRCIGWLKVQGITTTLVIATVDFVLMFRVWIIYGRPQPLIWLFAFLGLMEVSTMMVVDFVAYAQTTEYVHLGPILKGCYAYNVPRFVTTYAAAPLLVRFIMFAMTVYKCGTTLQRYEAGVMQIWKLFLRDGVLWFLAVFAAAGAALLIWTMQRETLKQLLVVPALV
ncbi:hypothetical protein B0H14DRAFT_3665580 [Mycena olivaceomarginata]|nr:hypothetical protein B0H14DRAFT_3665580 [Mycena olivaceomarginata]